MKKLIVASSLIFILAAFLWSTKSNENAISMKNSIEEMNPTESIVTVKDTTSFPKPSKQRKKISKSEDKNIFHAAKTCAELKAMCVECAYQFEDLVEVVRNLGLEAAGAGKYSLMHRDSLKSLADSGDPEAMKYYGINLGWLGSIGLEIFRDPSIPINHSEIIKNHKYNPELIEQGKAYLYQAALHDNVVAWGELQVLMGLQFRSLLKNKSDDVDIIENILAKYLAIPNVVEKIYINDQVSKELYLNGIKISIDSLLKKWLPKASKVQILEKQARITELSKTYTEQYLTRWIQDRQYLGKDIHPAKFLPSFSDYHTRAEQLCSYYFE